MTRDGPHSLTEEDLEPSTLATADGRFDLAGERYLLVGGPQLCRNGLFADWEGVTLVSSVEDVTNVDADDLLVIHDFYRLLFETQLEADEETLDQLLELAAGPGVCLALEPRSLEWLIERGDLVDELDLLDSYTICVFEYDTDDPDGFVTYLRERYDLNSSQDVRAELSKLGYRHDFTEPRLQELLGSYESYIPGLVPLVTDLDETGGFFPELPSLSSIHDQSVSLSAEFIEEGFLSTAVQGTVGRFVDGLTTELPALVDTVADEFEDPTTDMTAILDNAGVLAGLGSTSLGALGISGSLVAGPFAAVGGLLLWRRLRGDDEDAIQEYFGTLLSERLYPHTRAKLEARLGVPPMTLTILGERLRDGDFEQVDALVRFASEHTELSTSEAEMALDDLEDRYDDALDELESSIQELDARVAEIEPTAAFISDSVDNAMDDLEGFSEELRREEADVLDVESVNLDDVLELYVGNQPDEIVDAIVTEGADLVLLRGGHGTGKTTAGYLACRTLAEQYTIRLPNFEDEGIRFTERHLRDRVDARDRTVVYTSYRTGTYPFLDDSALKRVLQWTTNDVCEAVILECRDERVGSLKRTVTDLTTDRWQLEPPSLTHTWREKRTVPFERLPDAKDVRPLVAWTLRNVHGRVSESLLEHVVEFAGSTDEGYNPGIAKATAAHIHDTERPLSAYDTIEELVWNDIKSAVGSEATCAPVFAHLCATRTMLTSELTAVVSGYGRGDLEECLTELRASIGGTVRANLTVPNGDRVRTPAPNDRWRVVPEITADAVFRFNTITEQHVSVGQIATNIIHADVDGLLPTLAAHLASAHESAVAASNDEYRAAVQEEATKLLETLSRQEASPLATVQCLDKLLRANVAVSPDLLVEYDDHLREGFERIAANERYDTATFLLNQFGWLAVANQVRGSSVDLADLIKAYEDVFEDSGAALNNAASMALFEFVGLFTVSDATVMELELEATIETLEAAVLRAHGKFDQGVDESHELANVYSFALDKIALRYTPAEVNEELETLFSHLCETVREDSEFDTHYPAKVVAMTLAQFATHGNTPPEAWATHLTHVVRYMARALVNEVNVPPAVRPQGDDEKHRTALRLRTFLLSVYIEAFFQLAAQRSPEGAAQWVEFLLDAHGEALEELLDTDVERTELTLRVGSESVDDDPDPYYWLGAIHASVVSVAADSLMLQPEVSEDPEDWIRCYVRVFAERGASLPARPDAGVCYLASGLLENLFTDTTPEAFKPDVDPVEPDVDRWLPVVTDAVRDAADRLDVNPGELLAEVYDNLLGTAGLEIAASESGYQRCTAELERLGSIFPDRSDRFESLSERLDALS